MGITMKNYQSYSDPSFGDEAEEYPECIGWHTWLTNGYVELFYALPSDPRDDYMYSIDFDKDFITCPVIVPGATLGNGDETPTCLSRLFEDYRNPTEGELIAFELEFSIPFPILNEEKDHD